jgi:hypothetical protein
VRRRRRRQPACHRNGGDPESVGQAKNGHRPENKKPIMETAVVAPAAGLTAPSRTSNVLVWAVVIIAVLIVLTLVGLYFWNRARHTAS